MTNTLKRLSATAALSLLVTAVAETRAQQAATKGAEVGKWTQDYDAALKLAAKEKLPVLLNFTGSDWCQWCQLMTKNVFDEKEWQDYAAEKLVLVTLDYPQDATLVPAEYKARNDELNLKYGVEGFPTYILLEDNGEDVLGRIKAEQDPTPASFIENIGRIVRYRPVAMAAYAEGISKEHSKVYREAAKGLVAAEARLKELAAARKKAEAEKKVLREKIDAIHIDVRAEELGPAKGKEYKKLVTELAETRKELRAWLGTRPTRTPENTKKFEDFNERIKGLKADIAEM